MPDQTISWEAPEFRYYQKNLGWYVVAITVAILVMAFFVIVQSDIFAAVSIGIITILIIIFSRQIPRRVQVELSNRGIKFDNLFYPYKQLKYFWVVHNERHQTVIFHTTAVINHALILELEDQDPDAIRSYLLQYLPEHSETQETMAQKMMHLFKF